MKKLYIIIALCVTVTIGAVVFATQNIENIFDLPQVAMQNNFENEVSYELNNDIDIDVDIDIDIEQNEIFELFEFSNIEVQAYLRNELFSEITNNLDNIADIIYNNDRRTVNEYGDVVINTMTRRLTLQRNIDFDRGFKIYGVNTADLVADYLRTQNFAALISEDFSLNVPVLADDGSIISMAEMRKIRGADSLVFAENTSRQARQEMIDFANAYEGQWLLATIGMYLPLEAAYIFSNNEKLNQLLNSTGITGIQNVKIVTLFDYGMDIIYFSARNQEFAIPFIYNPDFFPEIQSGRVYIMQELIDIIFNIFYNN